MEKEYAVKNFTISVSMEEGVIHIINDKRLWEMLNDDRLANSRLLVRQVTEAYNNRFGKPLDITESSLVAELWGHVYIEYFTRAIHELLAIAPVKMLVNKVVKYCAVIDCGETGKDSNRFIWDMLSGQVENIDKLLPGRIDTGLLQ